MPSLLAGCRDPAVSLRGTWGSCSHERFHYAGRAADCAHGLCGAECVWKLKQDRRRFVACFAFVGVSDRMDVSAYRSKTSHAADLARPRYRESFCFGSRRALLQSVIANNHHHNHNHKFIDTHTLFLGYPFNPSKWKCSNSLHCTQVTVIQELSQHSPNRHPHTPPITRNTADSDTFQTILLCRHHGSCQCCKYGTLRVLTMST